VKLAINNMKKILRWLILGGTLFFVTKAFKDNWQDVSKINIDAPAWAILVIACGITLLAHIWAGWVWTWVLKELNQQVPTSYFIQVYLKTNIAKYLPGNIWHHYGRIVAAKEARIPAGVATLSVILEPLLMAVAALIIIIIFADKLLFSRLNIWIQILKILSLIIVICLIHPLFLNTIISLLQKFKIKKSSQPSVSTPIHIERYPLKPLMGEFGFLVLRAIGFILTIFALSPVSLNQVPLLLGTFSFAWLLGFVIPGAPGGIGVFEATAISLLQYHFPAAVILGAVALYRLISIFAEAIGATLAWCDEKLERF
jgi:glycosyltransferase 2 family protein